MAKHHIETTVNGDAVEFLCETEDTLLDVLRDTLNMTGSKEGCASGDCGACSVTLDGRLVCSCLVLGCEVAGRRIETIEGLAKGEFVVEFHVPKPKPHQADAYLRFIPRTEMDIAVVGCAVNVTLDNSGVCTDARVSLGAVAPTQLVVDEAAQALIGHRLDDDTLAKLDTAAGRACKPINDKRGTIEYRIKVAGVLARRAAAIAFERAGAR